LTQKNIIRIEKLIYEIEVISKQDIKLKLPVGSLLVEIGLNMLKNVFGPAVACECVEGLIDFNLKTDDKYVNKELH